MIAIVRAKPLHVRMLAESVRPEDYAEGWAMDRKLPLEGGLFSLERSTVAFTGFADGQLLAVAGVVPGLALAGCGMPWVLSGTAVERHRRAYAEASRRMLARFHEIYPVLATLMAARYTRAVAWARWLGFTVSEPFPYGPDGEPFVQIVRRVG